MNKLEQFFIEKGSSKSTQGHYLASVKLYEKITGLSFDDLLIEADLEEEKGVRWKKRKLKSYLIEFRNYLYTNKSEGTAKQYLADIKTLYRHYEIELLDLPSFASKQIDKTYEMDFDDILTKEELISAYHEANNVVKCILLFASSSGLSRVDFLRLTVGDFIEACNVKNNDLIEQLNIIKSDDLLIPCFKGNRKKTNKPFITFCSPEASKHIAQYLIGRNSQIRLAYEQNKSIMPKLSLEDKLFDISESHLATIFKQINDKLEFGRAGKNRRFRPHMLRKYQATTLLNVENGFTVEEIDTLQGRSMDKTHRAYFHNSKEKLYKKYWAYVDELMLFESIHEIDKKAYERLEKENDLYKNKIENQEERINKILETQNELEKLLRLEKVG